MPKITEMYAFIMADKDEDDEGVPGLHLPDGTILPMVGADMGRIADLKPFVEQLVAQTGKSIKLVKFTKLEIVATITADK